MTPLQTAVEMLGGVTRSGRTLGVSHEAVRRWLAGTNRLTAERAKQIEQATAGTVKRHELRPDLFDAPPAANSTQSEAA